MKLIIVVGASASGKDTLFNEVLKQRPDIKPIISTTSRPIRTNENGTEYNFVSSTKINQMVANDEFIEKRIYNVASGEQWIYGITKDAINFNSNNTYMTIVDIKGLKEIEEYCIKNNMLNIYKFYIDVTAQERLRRSINREGVMSDGQVLEVCRRLLDDHIHVNKNNDIFDYVLSNETKEDFDNIINFMVTTL